MNLKKEFCIVVFILVLFFISVSNVFASQTLGGYTFSKTSSKTDYAKIELSDGNVMLIEFYSSRYPDLVEEVKSQLENYNGAFISSKSELAYDFKTGNEVTYQADKNYYSAPVLGDLAVAAIDIDNAVLTLSQFHLFVTSESVPFPVFAHVIYQDSDFNSFTLNTTIDSIGFVKILKSPSGSSNSSREQENRVLDSGTRYCSEEAFKKPFKFIGRILTIVKILIPLIIIIFGVIDFFKAIVGSKDDEIKKSMKSLVMRVISGVVIFFIPTLINLVFMLVDDWAKYSTDYSNCTKCLVSPNKC